MRALFFLLVLGNLAFFAWSQGYFGALEEGREPQRLTSQLFPEKMKVAVVGAAAAEPARMPPPTAATAATAATADCRFVDALPQADADKLAALVAEKGDGARATVLPIKEAPSYWVHLPAQPNRPAADRKAAELKPFGITEFKVLEQSDGFVVSLGLFRNEQSARDLLQAVQKKGARSALVTERETPATRAGVEIRGAAEWLARRLPELLPAGASAGECSAR